jgi:hypothetical protein
MFTDLLNGFYVNIEFFFTSQLCYNLYSLPVPTIMTYICLFVLGSVLDDQCQINHDQGFQVEYKKARRSP